MAKGKESPATADILVGMKSICDFLRVSEATVLKWRREYDDFPVKKNGQLTSSRAALNEWSRLLFSR